MSHDTVTHNRRTVQAYERYARDYAAAVSSQPSGPDAEALHRFASAIPRVGNVLEIGSGPGWDADFLETLGIDVHRTDVTAAFREFQAERGRRVDPLDLLTDEIPGLHHGLMLLCVLQHFERTQVDGVLCKLAHALAPGGALLLSHPLGEGESWQRGTSGDYRVVLWSREALDARLAQAGFAVTWEANIEGDDGPWRTLLARKQA